MAGNGGRGDPDANGESLRVFVVAGVRFVTIG
jgi:hypothetical protein